MEDNVVKPNHKRDWYSSFRKMRLSVDNHGVGDEFLNVFCVLDCYSDAPDA